MSQLLIQQASKNKRKSGFKFASLIIATGMLLACTNGPNGSTGSNTGPENSIQVKSTRLTDCADEVLEMKVMGNRSSQFSTDIVSPGAFKHKYKVITIDTTALGAGTLYISGKLGNSSQGSFALMSASPSYPCSGESAPAYSEVANKEPGSSFELKHSFLKGEVYRLLAEGSWHDPAGTANSVTWTIRVDS